MAVDFRCEQCGKLLSVNAEPGSDVKCPHCQKTISVPAGLASLPRPQVPPNAQKPPAAPPTADRQAAQGEPEGEGEEEVVVEAGPSAVVTYVMPWALSLMLHVGVAMILMFVAMIVVRTALPEEVVVPNTLLTAEPNAAIDAGSMTPDVSNNKATEQRMTSKNESSISSDSGETNKRVALIGVGGGGPQGGGAILGSGGRGGPRGRFFGVGGNAHHIVYVIDRSGSMSTEGTFDRVRAEMLTSISRLGPDQNFHVIFFAEAETKENTPRSLVPATEGNKVDVAKFVKDVAPAGATTALPALKRAFEVLVKADRKHPGKLIYLLTDGEFAGIGGGSVYTRGSERFAGNEAVIEWLRDNNKSKEIHVNTFLYGYKGKNAVEVMTTIAKENNGSFKSISHDE